MSHHFDSAADRADGRINPCDLYASPEPMGPASNLPATFVRRKHRPCKAHKLQFTYMP